MNEAFAARIGIQPLHKLRALGRNTPVAFSALTGTAKMAAEGKQCRCSNIAGIRAKRDGLHDVRCAADAAADNNGNAVADSFVTESLINSRQGEFNRDTNVIADTCRCCARAAAEPVNRNDVRTAAGNAAGNGSNVMDSGNLDDDRFSVFGSLFERKDELTKIFNRINIVVRSR